MIVLPIFLPVADAVGSIRLLAPMEPCSREGRERGMIVLPISLPIVAAFGSIRPLALMEPCSRPPTGGEGS